MARKNIKVPEDTFQALKEDKPDGVTWPDYLEARCLQTERDTPVSQERNTGGIQDELQEVERSIKNRIDDLETELRTQHERLQR